jgi:hypothetical protein
MRTQAAEPTDIAHNRVWTDKDGDTVVQ